MARGNTDLVKVYGDKNKKGGSQKNTLSQLKFDESDIIVRPPGNKIHSPTIIQQLSPNLEQKISKTSSVDKKKGVAQPEVF